MIYTILKIASESYLDGFVTPVLKNNTDLIKAAINVNKAAYSSWHFGDKFNPKRFFSNGLNLLSKATIKPMFVFYAKELSF